MTQGFSQLIASKKGAAFSGTSAVIGALMMDGSLPVDRGAMYLVILAVAHIIGQGIADTSKPK